MLLYIHINTIARCPARCGLLRTDLRMAHSPPEPRPTIGDDLLRLLESKEGGDVTFQVEQSEFFAHTLVLAARSSLHTHDRRMRRVLRPSGASSGSTTRAPRPSARSSTSSTPTRCPQCGTDAMRALGELLGAANRYGLVRMRHLIGRALREAVVDAATAPVLADRHGCAELKAFCIRDVVPTEVLRKVVRTDGYVELKASRPVVVAEILEQVAARLGKEERRASAAPFSTGICHCPLIFDR
jgi:speckle-type POZ protein